MRARRTHPIRACHSNRTMWQHRRAAPPTIKTRPRNRSRRAPRPCHPLTHPPVLHLPPPPPPTRQPANGHSPCLQPNPVLFALAQLPLTGLPVRGTMTASVGTKPPPKDAATPSATSQPYADLPAKQTVSKRAHVKSDLGERADSSSTTPAVAAMPEKQARPPAPRLDAEPPLVVPARAHSPTTSAQRSKPPPTTQLPVSSVPVSRTTSSDSWASRKRGGVAAACGKSRAPRNGGNVYVAATGVKALPLHVLLGLSKAAIGDFRE
ncbi:hypothetical protein BCR44DRAFT_1170071 [Catenaria anguillulae PL171]|uniref:Uncharacterized protein n=1 Tax=Catenaria anguillulae PL171 TaxID=765915 RepID=A0A1Y2I2J5_9FUNG|nr:hypothetical protein BCR44DRAFT_1170051 [Catenaria anguillulae PL171]ORZ40178.1 hypothetical protein BCR44DRAFT_1170071 [Catenaria anguillulae PL171]